MTDIYARSFMIATGASPHFIRDVKPAHKPHERWPRRGRRWKPVDLSKL